ncbi:MAG TPA: SIMPL domain-containing protein [Gemmatimonadaceae bacterium]|nr:SIMPL domain-containing protein [Gemmatimonadaceae bacterium]
MRHMLAAGITLVVVLGGLGSVQAQELVRPAVPQIVTSAQGEVRIAPDRATITIGVQTRAATAADAAQQNSRKQRAVIDAIKARGVPAEQITTMNFNVIPETRYDREGGTPRVTSYLVSNDVTVELRRIDQVGPVIDAALAAGANQINSLAFGIASPDSARRVALASAVGKARADAEAMAKAAGGSLGPLIELVAADVFIPPPRPMMLAKTAAVAAEAVPIEAGEQAVRANVTARWQFVGPGR